MSVTLVKIPNPFQPDINNITTVDYTEGRRLDQYLQDLPGDIPFVVAVNGTVIEDSFQTTAVNDGDIISACAKTEFEAAAAVASWVVTTLTGNLAMGGLMGLLSTGAIGAAAIYGATFLATSFVIGYGMSALASALAPDAPQTGLSTDTGKIEQVYGWGDLQQTTIEGVQIPYIFGACRVAGHVINQFIDIKDNDEFLNVMLAVADHEVNSISDIRINNQPAIYYKGAVVHTDLTGTTTDRTIQEFGSVVEQQDVNAKLLQESAVWRQTSGNQVEALKIIITAPGGLYYANTAGGFDANSVQFTVHYRVLGSPTWTLFGEPITYSGNTAGAKRWTVVIGSDTAPLPAARYEVSVTRLTPDPESDPATAVRNVNSIYFTALQEIIFENLVYPGLAKYAVQVQATDQLSGGLPSLSCLATRTTLTVKNTAGTEAVKRATNPAWMVWWLLSVAGISHDRIIFEDFEAWAAYGDETVAGAYRFEFNVVVQSGNAWDEIQKIARLGRAAIIRRGTRYGVFVDKYEGSTPIVSHLFTMGNIVENTYNMQYLPQKDRANAVEVEYTDINRDHTRQVVTVYGAGYIESERISQKASVSIQAATTQAVAVREAVFRINSNQHLSRVITFDAFLDSFACTVGDLFYFQHEIMDYGTDSSGRIVAATSTTVTLDKSVTIVSGQTYKIMVRIGSLAESNLVERTVTTAPGTTDTLTVSPAFATLPAQFDVYSFGRVDTYKKIYRLISVTRSDDWTRTITGLEYVPEVYTSNDSLIIDDLTGPGWMTGKQLAIGVSVNEYLQYAADGTYISALSIAWHMTYSQKMSGWDVWIEDRTSGSITPRLAQTTNRCNAIVSGNLIVGHTYRIYIVVSGEGPIDTGNNTADVTIQGKLAPPANVLNFSAAWDSIQRAVILTWNHVNDIDLSYYEIRQGGVWASATKLLITKDSFAAYYVSGAVAGTITYLIKAVDTSGIESVSAASTSLTFNTSSTEIQVPTGLAWTSSTNIGTDGTDIIMMLISWDNNAEVSSSFSHYIVRIEDTAIGKVTQFMCTSNFFQVYALPSHEYTVAVAAVDKAGNQTAWSTGVTDTTTKDVLPPEAPTDLSVNGTFTNIILTWAHSAEADMDHFIIFRNTSNDSSTAVQVGTAVKEFSGIMGMFMDAPPTDDEYWYWVAAVDSSGNISDLSDGASGNAPGVSVADGSITETKIADDAITTPKILANAIIASKIAAGQIGTDHLVAGAVTAAKISVTALSAITANIGTVTAGRIQNAANTTYLDLTNNLFSLGGQLTWNGSSLSIGGAISGTATINGTNAATVVSNAASGATFTSSHAGSLAYLSGVGDSHVTGVTSIMGGKVTTARIQSNDSGSYYDLSTGRMHFSASGLVTFNSGSFLWGNSGTIAIHAGSYGTSEVQVTTSAIYLNNAATSITYTGGTFAPSTDLGVSFGGASNRINTLYVHNIAYWGAITKYDIIDDLDALHGVKTDDAGRIDIYSLPESLLTFQQAREKLRADNGDMLSADDIEEILRDPDGARHMVGLDPVGMTFLVEGAVRQLDRETSDLIQQAGDWMSNIDQRLKLIEGRMAW